MLFLIPTILSILASSEVNVKSVAERVTAVSDQPEHARIQIAAGNYRLAAPLDVKSGVK